MADAHHCTWAISPTLVVPYVIDQENRCVWVNGRLEIPAYFEAIGLGIDEIVRNLGTENVVPFRQRTG